MSKKSSIFSILFSSIAIIIYIWSLIYYIIIQKTGFEGAISLVVFFALYLFIGCGIIGLLLSLISLSFSIYSIKKQDEIKTKLSKTSLVMSICTTSISSLILISYLVLEILDKA